MANNHDVFHAWANQTRDSKRAGHVSFDGPVLRSYSAIIGLHLTYKGNTVTLMSERKYSVTTSSHQSSAWSAANHLSIIRVPDIPSEFQFDNPKGGSKVVFDLWLRDAQSIANKLATARKPASYIEDLDRLGKEVDKLAAFARVRVPSKLRKLLDLPKSEDWREVLGAQAERTRQREAKRKADQDKQNAISIDAWQAFGDVPEGCTYHRTDRDYLRFNRETDRVETSQHVEVPIKLARLLYAWLISTRASGGCTDCDYTILNYRVRSVKQQYFEIGCHTIYFDQVEYIAGLLGWEGV